MTYAKICNKCNETFIGNSPNDNMCVHCDGSMPRLKYYELKEK